MMANAPYLQWALAYARAGFRVIPVNGKIPLTTHGAHDGSSDKQTITEWWQRWPTANIGLTLDGLVAVDIDPRNGGAVEHLPHPLPTTCTAKTGGGGLHYLYRARVGTNYPGKFCKGIDLKAGAGAYIVVAPSVHASGIAYEWIDKSAPWEMPPSIAPEWLAQAPRSTHAAPAEGMIPEGGRNNHLASLAGRLRKNGMDVQQIEIALRLANANRCNPPLPEDEVAAIAKSISRYAPLRVETTKHEWPNALDLTALATREPQPPQNIMAGMPCGYLTETFAHGGTGKSQIELMRLVCIASGLPFCGLPVERRRVLFLSCEDRADVLHWRLSRICRHLGTDMASLAGWLQILDLVGHPSILYAPDSHSGHALTAAYGLLADRMKEYSAQVLAIDGISDTYGGNENARAEVKAFVNHLLALIPSETGAVLLIGHIDKASAKANATTEGYSGSTAWHNAARARWFLYPEAGQGEDGGQATRTGKLILELQKANYGEIGTQIEFDWDANAHLFTGRLLAQPTDFDKKHRDKTEREGILAAMKGAAASVPPIDVPAATTGQRTGYKVLKLRPEFPSTLREGKVSRDRFWNHIEHLRQMHVIEEGSIKRINRHRTAVLTLTTEGARQCVEC